MPPDNLGHVIHSVPNGEPLIEHSEDRCKGCGRAGNTTKRETGNQVARVRLGIEQRRIDPRDGSRGLVVGRRNRHATTADAKNEFIDQRRSNRFDQRDGRNAARAILAVGNGQRPIPRRRRGAVGELLVVVIVDPPDAQPRRRVDLPVSPHNEFAARIGAGDLRRIVVRIAASRRIRSGQEVQDRFAGAILAAGRNKVAAKRSARGRIGDHDRLPSPVDGTREIARPLGRRGNQNIDGSRLRNQLPIVFLAHEEEQLVPAVHNVRNHDRTAKVPAIVVIAVQRPREPIAGSSTQVVEKWIGVQAVMTPEIASAAVELIRAAAGREGNQAAARATVFSLVVRGHDFHFLEGIRIHRHQRAGVITKIQISHAVDRVLVLRAARAVD